MRPTEDAARRRLAAGRTRAYLRTGPLVRRRGGRRQPLGKVPERDRVAVVDPHVGGVEDLEVDVGDADALERPAKRLGAEVEEPLIPLTGVDVDRAHGPQRLGVS